MLPTCWRWLAQKAHLAQRAKPESKPAAAKPKPAAAKKAAPKAAAKSAAPANADWDSPSILTGGARADQPRPLSKAEAAAKTKDAPAGKAGKPKRVAPPMPQKPAYAKPAAKADVESRRGFLAVMLGTALGVGYTAMATTFGLWGLALARFMFPNVLREPPSQFKVGFPSDYSFGMVETKFKAQFGVWIARYEYNGAPQLYALSTVCTHLGCTPNWLEGEQKFKCPCHGSGFYKDGINFEGPAPRPLERYAIKIADDGQVEVDKSRKFQQEMGQWEDPSSFVPV